MIGIHVPPADGPRGPVSRAAVGAGMHGLGNR